MFRKCIEDTVFVVHIVGLFGANIQPMRDKRKKFVQLAEARVARAMNDIRLIGNLSNRGAYTYDHDDVRKIFKTLQRELDAAKSKFGGETGSRETEFRLGE